ncbi:MAG: 30S ribosomal protein S17 [Nitrospirota bacterium]
MDLKKRKEFVGDVVSDKGDKTVIVSVERIVKDPRFKKYIRRSTRFMAHDAENACHVGDRVKFIETRPLSARKRWVVLEIIEKTREV